MQKFIEKFRDQICGTLSGFDRLVLRGSPRRLEYASLRRQPGHCSREGHGGVLVAERSAIQGLR